MYDLEEIRNVRETMVAALTDKISLLKQEKFAMDSQYDEEIKALEEELRALGVVPNMPLPSKSTDVSEMAERIYKYLCENPGHQSPMDIRKNVRGCVGVVSIILEPLIQAGRIEAIGERKGRTYKAVSRTKIDNPAFFMDEKLTLAGVSLSEDAD